MKIMIAGAGAVGSMFAPLCGQPRNQVLYYEIDRTKAGFLKAHGICLETQGSRQYFAVDIATTIPREAQDIIIIAVKTTANRTLYPALRLAIGKDTKILTVQNGWGNCEQLAELYGEAHLFAGSVYSGGYQEADYRVVCGGIGKMAIACWQQGALTTTGKQQEAQALADILQAAGLKAEYAANARQMLWRKLIINSVINPLTAYYEIENGGIFAPSIWPAAQRLSKESVAVANACGGVFDVAEMERALQQAAQDTATNRSSMLVDWQRGGGWELEAINGEIVRLGLACGIAVEEHQWVVCQLKEKQRRRDALQNK